MPLYTHEADETRRVREVGDIRNVIINLTRDETPLLNLFPNEGIQEVSPVNLEDTLRAFNAANRYAQDAEAPAETFTDRTEAQNHTQILMDSVVVTDTLKAVKQYGMSNEFDYQRGKKFLVHRRDIEGFILSDQAAQEATTAAAHTGAMGGLGALIQTHVGTVFTNDEYDDVLGDCVEGGGGPYIAFMDRARKAAVNAWTTAPTRFTTQIQRLEKEVLVYHSDIGPDVQMRWHYLMPRMITAAEPVCFVLDPALWRVGWLRRTWWKPLADLGYGPRGVWKSEVTLRALAEKGNVQFLLGASPSPSPVSPSPL